MFFIDNFLLKLATKVSRAFNWMTGKDNLYLAVLLAWMNLAIGVAGFMVHHHFHDAADPSFLPQGALCFLGAAYIFRAERIKEQVQSAKQSEPHLFLLVARIVGLTALAIGTLQFTIGTSKPMHYIADEGYIFVSTAMYYFLSVDRPPFAKSQLKEWLKSFVENLLPQPAPQPILSA